MNLRTALAAAVAAITFAVGVAAFGFSSLAQAQSLAENPTTPPPKPERQDFMAQLGLGGK